MNDPRLPQIDDFKAIEPEPAKPMAPVPRLIGSLFFGILLGAALAIPPLWKAATRPPNSLKQYEYNQAKWISLGLFAIGFSLGSIHCFRMERKGKGPGQTKH